jgi:hypothetical protein
MATKGGPFQIDLTNAHRRLLRAWGRQAAAAGRLQLYLDDLAFLNSQLKTNPLKWGDPLFTYKLLKWKNFRGLTNLFVVYYGVDTVRKIVILKDLLVKPGIDFLDHP